MQKRRETGKGCFVLQGSWDPLPYYRFEKRTRPLLGYPTQNPVPGLKFVPMVRQLNRSYPRLGQAWTVTVVAVLVVESRDPFEKRAVGQRYSFLYQREAPTQ